MAEGTGSSVEGDPNPLDQFWVPRSDISTPHGPSGYYKSGKGNVSVMEQNLEFKVDHYLLEGAGDTSDSRSPRSPEDMPAPSKPLDRQRTLTQQRVDVILRSDIAQAPDGTFIFFPGWGEVSASFLGKHRSFLVLLVELAKTMGYQNPSFIFPNLNGRGTKEYVEANSASELGFGDFLGDVARLPQRFFQAGHLGGSVTVMGHSIGEMSAWAMVEALEVFKQLNRDAAFNVAAHASFMPATGEALGALRADFLCRVKELVPAALEGACTGESLKLTRAQYNRLMFGDFMRPNRPDWDGFKRSVPDSARLFFEWVLNLLGKGLPMNVQRDNFKAHILASAKDTLLPKGMAAAQNGLLEKRGVEGQFFLLEKFGHGIPFDMTADQMDELWVSLRASFVRSRS